MSERLFIVNEMQRAAETRYDGPNPWDDYQPGKGFIEPPAEQRAQIREELLQGLDPEVVGDRHGVGLSFMLGVLVHLKTSAALRARKKIKTLAGAPKPFRISRRTADASQSSKRQGRPPKTVTETFDTAGREQ